MWLSVGIMVLVLGGAGDAVAQNFTGNLDATSHPSDWIPFTLSNDGDLTLRIAVGPYLNLNAHPSLGIASGVMVFDSTGTNLLYSAQQGQGTTLDHSVRGLGAGSYFVRLTAIGDYPGLGWGDYSLTLLPAPDPLPNDIEPNDDLDHALPVSLNGEAVGHLGYLGPASVIEKQDFWKVTIPSDGTLQLDIRTGTLLNLNVNPSVGAPGGVMVYDADRATVFYSALQGQDTLVTHSVPKLKAGLYYIRLVVLGNTTGYYGSYRMVPKHVPESVINDAEPDDQPSQSIQLPLDTIVTGHLGFYGAGSGSATDPQDWWRLTLPHAGDLAIEISTSESLNLNVNSDVGSSAGVSLYDSDAATLLFGENQGQGTALTHLAQRLKPGTYYVRLTKLTDAAWYGGYRLKARLLPVPEDPEPNDAANAAGTAQYGSVFEGNLGYRGGGSGAASDQLDWWRFTVPVASHLVMVVKASSMLNLNANWNIGVNEGITLFGSAAGGGVGDRLLGASQGQGTTLSYELDIAPGTYYIRLTKNGDDYWWGTYSVGLSYASPPLMNGPTTARGVTGLPFYCTLNAPGANTFGADSLPTGLSMDPASGTLSGTLGAAGVYDTTVFATNAYGTASAPLQITVLPLPTLAIQQGAANQVAISWPGDYASFALWSATAVGTNATWNVVTPYPSASEGVFKFTDSTGDAKRFYRLLLR